jgi:acetyl-CoA/propionyl-CoA carboxylase biotin carboxyl carrier protein
MISGIDLVREQILVAAGVPLAFAQDDVVLRGHAIEVRVNAEDPADDFRPAPGTIGRYREPGGFGVRVDSAAYPGYTIVPDYDSMIAKLIVWGSDRAESLQRLARAIDEFTITGVPTTLPLARALCDFGPVQDASYGTATLEPFAASLGSAAAGAETDTTAAEPSAPPDETMRVEVNGKLMRVRFVDLPPPLRAASAPAAAKPVRGVARKAQAPQGNDVVAPMNGVVVEIPVRAGATVAEGDVVAVIEAMKMMNEIRAHKSGTIAAVHVAAGASVEARAPLVTFG